ncbi:MAG: septum formation initiator family protein [Bacilli bacterium]|nr:septum formation initiator family protein [Bacilli bacterium]
MKKYRLRLLIYLGLLVSIGAILSLSCFSTWKQIVANRKTKEELTSKYSELLENEESLEGEVVKLQDPEYVAKYAREKYLFTKDGELIIDMGKSEE